MYRFLINQALYINQELNKQIVEKHNLKNMLIERLRRLKSRDFKEPLKLSYDKPFFGGIGYENKPPIVKAKQILSRGQNNEDRKYINQYESLEKRMRTLVDTLSKLDKDILAIKHQIKQKAKQ